MYFDQHPPSRTSYTFWMTQMILSSRCRENKFIIISKFVIPDSFDITNLIREPGVNTGLKTVLNHLGTLTHARTHGSTYDTHFATYWLGKQNKQYTFVVSSFCVQCAQMKQATFTQMVTIPTVARLNLLKTKRRLLYLNTQFVPRTKHFSSWL